MKLEIIKSLFSKINNEKYYPYYILILSFIILFFRLNGSLGNWDEACYSEIAKEGLTNGNWFNLNYLGNIWFEKPPFVIWLTIVSYKLFGINEFAIWFFPVVFGILGILGVYYLAKILFNSKVGLFSSLVLLSIPHYLLLARNNMMDIFVFTLSLYAFIFLIQSKNKSKYLLISAVLLGFSFLSKNIISILIILPAVIYYLFFINNLNILKNKYLRLSILLFFLIILPWHLVMIYRYQWNFLDTYVGYHLFERFSNNVVTMKGSEDIFHYLKVIILRSGSWWFVFLLSLPVIFNNIKNKIHRKKLLLLIVWGLSLIIFFTASATKIHHYILPFYISMSILISFALYDLLKKNSLYLLLPLLLIFFNINNSVILRTAKLGESKIIVPAFLEKVFNHSTTAIFSFSILLFLIVFYSFILKKKKFASQFAIIVIFLFSALLPIKPDRSPLSKEIGRLTMNTKIKKIYLFDLKQLNIRNSLLFYNYPIEIIELKKEVQFKPRSVGDSSSYCLTGRKLHNGNTSDLKFTFYPCEIIE